MGYDFIPADKNAKPIHKDVKYELEEYPEDKTEPASGASTSLRRSATT